MESAWLQRKNLGKIVGRARQKTATLVCWLDANHPGGRGVVDRDITDAPLTG